MDNNKLIIDKDKKMTGYATIDKPWLKYFDTEFRENDIPNKSIYQFALDSNKYNMKDIAIDVRTSMNGFSKGIKISYKTLFDRIQKSSKSSKILEINKNEIVPIILPNIPEARILIYSNSVLGAISYPISPLLPVNQLQQIINENQIKNLFIFSGFYEKYEKALKNTDLNNIVLLDGSESLPKSVKFLKDLKNSLMKKSNNIFKNDKRIISWSEYDSYSKQIKESITPFYQDDHVTAIIGTSGTTGISKGVCLTDKNINTVACAYKNGKLFEGTFMDALLPSIGYGISMLHYQTVSGKYTYLIPELLTTKFPESLEKLKPDNFAGGPVHSINLLNSDYFKKGKMYKINNLVSGGASLPKDVELKLNRVNENYTENGINENLVVRQGYGLSENTAMGTYSLRGSYKFGSIGIPMPYITIGIFEPGTDKELKYGELGELCITGPSVMKKYLNNEEETNNVILVHSDGKRWIHTKDICYMDNDGHVFHVDRIKNIFMRTGFNVHPAKIAEFINSISYVKNSVVIGFEHPKEQCVPVAFIQLDNEEVGNNSLSKIENLIKNECIDNLEESSVPYEFVFVDDLPINVGGKIDIRKIKEQSQINFNLNPKMLKKTLNFKK